MEESLIDIENKKRKSIALNSHDVEYLTINYPTLQLLEDKIIGNILISREYKGKKVNEDFNIEINLFSNINSMLPIVKCTDSKMDLIAKKLKVTKDELHINSDGSFCLTINIDEEKYFDNEKFNIKDFFENLLIPYLFWISYYYKYGEKPWGEYSHGIYGIFEYIYEVKPNLEKIQSILKSYKLDLNILKIFYRQFYCFDKTTTLEKLLCFDKKFKKDKKIKFRKVYKKVTQGILYTKGLLWNNN